MPEKTHRKRGAQLGNTNALKHGFYTRRLLETQPGSALACAAAELDEHQFPGMEEEINTLRLYIRRLVEVTPEDATVDQMIGIVRTLDLSFASLTRLLRVTREIKRDQLREYLRANQDAQKATFEYSMALVSKLDQEYEQEKK